MDRLERSEVGRLERTVRCKDDRGRRYTVHVLLTQGSWTGTDGILRRFEGFRKFVLSDDPRRSIKPGESVDTFEIEDDGTIIRGIEQPRDDE